MPELPDLQVFASNLQKKLKGKKMTGIEVHATKKIHASEKELNQQFAGKTLKHVYRQGKQLYFDFGKVDVFSMHLMLHGKLVLQNSDEELPKHPIVTFQFNKQYLVLTDFQKMATITVNPQAPVGIDALSEQLDAAWLLETLSKSRSTIVFKEFSLTPYIKNKEDLPLR